MREKQPRVVALRMAAKAFLIIANGGFLTPEEAKTFADLCCLNIPPKHRFTRAELDEIKSGVQRTLNEISQGNA